MVDLISIGRRVAHERKALQMSQGELAKKAGVSRATVDALENGRAGELGFTKLSRILTAVGLEMKLHKAGSQRPTLEQLLEEDRDDQGLERRR